MKKTVIIPITSGSTLLWFGLETGFPFTIFLALTALSSLCWVENNVVALLIIVLVVTTVSIVAWVVLGRLVEVLSVVVVVVDMPVELLEDTTIGMVLVGSTGCVSDSAVSIALVNSFDSSCLVNVAGRAFFG